MSANGNQLMKLHRSELLSKLRQQGKLGKVKITVLKSFAKRLGFDTSQRISRRNLERSLEKLMEDGVTVPDLPHPISSTSKVKEFEKEKHDPQGSVGLLIEKVQSMTVSSSHGTQPAAVSDNKHARTNNA